MFHPCNESLAQRDSRAISERRDGGINSGGDNVVVVVVNEQSLLSIPKV